MAGDFDDPPDPYGRDGIPDQLSEEGDPNGPKPEEPFNRTYIPETHDRRIAYEALQIKGVTIKMASRLIGVSINTFRKNFSREINEANKVRAQMNPGTDFSPMSWQRHQVSAMKAAGLEDEQICGIMFRGMEMSRFNALFGDDLSMGVASIVGVSMDRIYRAIRTGSDKDATLNARYILKQKGLGGFRDTTRYDHDTHGDSAEKTTEEKVHEAEEALIGEMVANGTERAVAQAMIKALSSSGKGRTISKLN